MKFFKQILFCLIITICTAKGGLFKKKTGNQLKPREFEDFEMKLPEMIFSLMRADMVLKAPKQHEFEGLQNGQKLLETDFPYLYQEITQAPETTATEYQNTGLDGSQTTFDDDDYEVITISSTESISTSTASFDAMDYKQICGRRMIPKQRLPAGAKSARIVGGENSPFGRWPWQISLGQPVSSGFRHRCGAALLNENWAITAAQCVKNAPISAILLRLGEHDFAEEGKRYTHTHQERRVKDVILHPKYDTKTYQYDLALLRFHEPVVFQPNIVPVCVPQTDDEFIGKTAYVTGWGSLYEDKLKLPSVLQEISVPIIDNTICEAMYRTGGININITPTYICAGWEKGGHDSCDGDTGGPMVLQRDDERFVLAGIVTFGFGCGKPSQPGIYTRISEFRDWINQILELYLYQEITAATITQAPETTTTSIEASTTFDDDDYEVITISSKESTSTASFDGMDYKQICGRRMIPEQRLPAGAKSARIVGGENSPFGRWPWQISLGQRLNSGFSHVSGAALLNENWAITAAHSVENAPISAILLRLGEHDFAEEGKRYTHQERRVHIVVLHPQYDTKTAQYDLALLRFHEPVVFQPNIIPVCIPQTDDEFIGKTAYVTGWGSLYEDKLKLPSVLQEISVPIIDNTICEAMYRTGGININITHIFICAGWEKGGHDPCYGDSGGPMVLQRDDGRFVLAGIVSFGFGCGKPNQPRIYTRISEFRDWIDQIVQFGQLRKSP